MIKSGQKWAFFEYVSIRGHPSRTSGLPGGGGVSENRTSIVIFIGILLLNPDTRGRGGSKNHDFCRTSLVDGPLSHQLEMAEISILCKCYFHGARERQFNYIVPLNEDNHQRNGWPDQGIAYSSE